MPFFFTVGNCFLNQIKLQTKIKYCLFQTSFNFQTKLNQIHLYPFPLCQYCPHPVLTDLLTASKHVLFSIFTKLNKLCSKLNRSCSSNRPPLGKVLHHPFILILLLCTCSSLDSSSLNITIQNRTNYCRHGLRHQHYYFPSCTGDATS